MISIRSITPLTTPNGIFSPNDIPATVAGDTLVVLIDWAITGAESGLVTDNATVPDTFIKVVASADDFFGAATEIHYCPSTNGGATSINLHDAAFFNAWVIAIYSDHGPIVLADKGDSSSSPSLVASLLTAPANPGAVQTTFSPDSPMELSTCIASFTDAEGVNAFYAACCAYNDGSGTKIADVSAPWTLEPYVIDPYGYFYNFGAAHLLTSVTPPVAVSPTSLTGAAGFVNEVLQFPNYSGQVRRDQSKTLNITASGNWSVTSDPWLSVTPSSGSGNGSISVALYKLEQNLVETDNGVIRPKSGTYSGSVTVTPASGSPVTIPVSLKVGYGDQIQEFK